MTENRPTAVIFIKKIKKVWGKRFDGTVILVIVLAYRQRGSEV